MLKWLKKVLYWIGVGVTVVIAVFLGGSPQVPPAKTEESEAPQKQNTIGNAITHIVDTLLYVPLKIVALFSSHSRK